MQSSSGGGGVKLVYRLVLVWRGAVVGMLRGLRAARRRRRRTATAHRRKQQRQQQRHKHPVVASLLCASMQASSSTAATRQGRTSTHQTHDASVCRTFPYINPPAGGPSRRICRPTRSSARPATPRGSNTAARDPATTTKNTRRGEVPMCH